MLYFTGATALTVLIAFISQKISRKKVLCFFLAAIPLFLLSAIRWNVGMDTWHTYTPEYLAVKADSGSVTEEEKGIIENCGKALWILYHGHGEEESITYETAQRSFSTNFGHTAVLFRGLERLLLLLNADVQWLYVITSAIIVALSFATILKQSDDPVLASLLFVITSNYFLSMNVVSQYIAIAICLFACVYAVKRKPAAFFALILLAAGFHVSALIFIPVYWLPRLKIKPIWCAISVVVCFLLAQFMYPLLLQAIETVVPAYARYFGRSSEFEWIFLALGAAVFVAGSWYFHSEQAQNPYYRLWFYMNVLGMMALCFSGRIPFMKRINYYFAAPHFLFLPLVLKCEKKQKLRILFQIVLILLFIAETIVAVGLLNKNAVLPYHAFFDGDRAELTEALIRHVPGLW